MQRRDFISLLGGAASWPMVPRGLRAQQMPVIGWLGSGTADGSATIVRDSIAGLRDGGYAEGRNLAIEYLWGDGRYEQMLSLATELANRNVSVIVASGVTAALAAKAATKTIPVVFGSGVDPVASGIVSSLSRPGANVTGISFYTGLGVLAKRLELLRSLVPQAKTIAVLMNPASPPNNRNTTEVREAASSLGIGIEIVNASSDTELEAAFQRIGLNRFDALVVGPDSFFVSRHRKIVALAAANAIPASYARPEYVRAGGLMSYAADIPNAYHQVGLYTARILKGEKPADLPVMQPTKFELIVNLKTARALALDVPAAVLALTDEVIE